MRSEVRIWNPEVIKKVPSVVEGGVSNPVQKMLSPEEKGAQDLQSSLDQADKTGSVKLAEKMYGPLPNEAVKDSPLLKTDSATRGGAAVASELDPQEAQFFKDYVNKQQAAPIDGLIAKKQFSDLDSLGLKGVLDYQAIPDGERTGRFADVEKYFNDLYQKEQDAGIQYGKKANYLTGLFKQSPEEIQQAMGKSFGSNPSFSMSSLFKDYQEAIDKGLTPKYDNLSDIIGWRTAAHEKAMAAADYFTHLREDGMIQPSGKAGVGWKTLDPDHFPKLRLQTDEGVYQGTYSAPAEIAKRINNYLGDPNESLAKVANVVSYMKRTLMTSGVPFTGINIHGFNILPRVWMAEGPIGSVKYLARMIAPVLGDNYLNSHLDEAADFVKHGANLDVENTDFMRQQNGEGVLNKLNEAKTSAFETPLFRKVIPATQLEVMDRAAKSLIKDGVNPDEAKTIAAHYGNNLFTGPNWKELGQSKDFQRVQQLAIFSPQWLKTNLNLGANMAKSLVDFKSPEGKLYRGAVFNLATLYTLMNAVNYKTSGHFMFQNDAGHSFDIEAGYAANGQKRYIRPLGTAVDFIRVPVDAATSLAKGEYSQAVALVRNRLSTPLGVMVSMLSGVDYQGNKIQGAGGYMGELSQLFAPSGVRSFINQLSNNASGGGEQTAASILGLPMRYSGGPSTQNLVKTMVGQGKSTQDINKSVNDMYNYGTIVSNIKKTLDANTLNDWGVVHPQKTDAQGNTIYVKGADQTQQAAVTYLNDLTRGGKLNQAELQMAQQLKAKGLSYNPIWDQPTGVRAFIWAAQDHLPGTSNAWSKALYSQPWYPAYNQQLQSYFASFPTVPGQAGQGQQTGLQAPVPTNQVQSLMDAKQWNNPLVQQYLQANNTYNNQRLQAMNLSPIAGTSAASGGSSGGGGMPSGLKNEIKYSKQTMNRQAKNVLTKAGLKSTKASLGGLKIGGKSPLAGLGRMPKGRSGLYKPKKGKVAKMGPVKSSFNVASIMGGNKSKLAYRPIQSIGPKPKTPRRKKPKIALV
jgi:hypothetical protein